MLRPLHEIENEDGSITVLFKHHREYPKGSGKVHTQITLRGEAQLEDVEEMERAPEGAKMDASIRLACSLSSSGKGPGMNRLALRAMHPRDILRAIKVASQILGATLGVDEKGNEQDEAQAAAQAEELEKKDSPKTGEPT